jgi:hypothetical protein
MLHTEQNHRSWREARFARIHNLIAVHAYYLWQNRTRTGSDGNPHQDWLVAEKYVKETYAYLFFHLRGCITHIITLQNSARCYICEHTINTTQPEQVQCEACGAILELVCASR